ncbi:MAG: hypothetical protein GY757_02950 [bacterium]|nr:hypothetical protein [bacterium]
MKVINDKKLKTLKNGKRVKAKDANTILSTKTATATPAAKKKPPVPKSPSQVDKLVITVTEVIKATTEMNQRATDLLKNMFIRVSAQPELPAPVVNMTMPEPWKKLRLTVTKRDRQGLMQEVEADRLE